MAPRVSIGVPVYNGERYLTEALDSILAQDFLDFEVIISDNASTDATQDICEAYCRRDKRITYSRLAENMGAARNYNRLVHMANGEFFKWAAHDDLLRPEFLSRCMHAFEQFSTPPAIVHPKAEFIDESSTIIRTDMDRMHADSDHSFVRAFQTLQAMSMTAPVMGVFHTATLRKTRLIGSFISSDYVLLLESGLLGKIVQLEGEPLFQRRIHEEMSRQANRTDKDVLRWFDPEARVSRSRRGKLYWEYLRAPIQLPELGWTAKALATVAIVGGVLFKRSRVFLGRHRRRVLSLFSGETS